MNLKVAFILVWIVYGPLKWSLNWFPATAWVESAARMSGALHRSCSIGKSLWAGGPWVLRTLRQPGFRSRDWDRPPQHTEGKFSPLTIWNLEACAG